MKQIQDYFDLSEILIVLLDGNMNILHINSFGARLIDSSPQELIGKSYLQLFIPKQIRPKLSDFYQDFVNGKEPEVQIYENPINTANHKEKIFNWRNIVLRDQNDQFIAALCFGYDKSEKSHKKLYFLENVKDKSIILENIQEHIIFQDLDQKILWANKAASDSLNLTKEDLIGRKCYSLWGERSTPCVGCPVLESIKREQPISREMSTPDGRHWLVKGVSVRDDQGTIIGAIETTLDITTEKKARLKIETSEKMYREAYTRAEFYKDLFAHDINNILQNIKSANEFAQSIKSKENYDKKSDDIHQVINRQVNRAAKLVENIRKLSHLEEREFILSPIDISPYLQKALNSVKKNFHHKQLDIQLNTFGNKIHIKANECIIDVFENILINSIKHNNNEQIEILINILRVQQNGGRFVRFEFIDNGIGITDKRKDLILQRHILERKTALKGIGLGLSLVKKIIDTFNGKIWVESRDPEDYRKGSKFIILIPESNSRVK